MMLLFSQLAKLRKMTERHKYKIHVCDAMRQGALSWRPQQEKKLFEFPEKMAVSCFMMASDTSDLVPTPHTADIYDKPMVSPYMVPVKRIKSQEDLELFLKSETLKGYLNFIEESSKAVVGLKISDQYPQSPVCLAKGYFLSQSFLTFFSIFVCADYRENM